MFLYDLIVYTRSNIGPSLPDLNGVFSWASGNVFGCLEPVKFPESLQNCSLRVVFTLKNRIVFLVTPTLDAKRHSMYSCLFVCFLSFFYVSSFYG